MEPSAELVAILHASKPLFEKEWQPLSRSIHRQILEFDGATNDEVLASATMKAKFLDESLTKNTARIVEVACSAFTAKSLRQCKALTAESGMQELLKGFGVQMVLQPEKLYQLHREPGLAVFDMDSTLIQQEVIDELARAVGFYDKVAAITEAAMRGEAPYTDFEASLRARVALLKGVPTSIWERLKKDVITFTPGAVDLVRALKRLGWKTAVFSGGFINLTSWVKDILGLDYAYANQLVVNDATNTLTGELVPGAPIIHAEKKRELLLEVAQKNSIPLERVIAVGDGSNDLRMMDAAGFGIAFNAKPKVQLAAPAVLNSPTLLDVMHLLGYSRLEVAKLIVPNSEV